MLLILIASALVVGVVMLGLSICRVAALSDRNSALALAESIAARRLADRQMVSTGRAGEQLLFEASGEAFRTVG
jgi:hypothetical protein